MWTATLDLSPRRVLLTQLLGRFWHGAYLSSFAPLRVENTPRQQLPGAQWVRVRNRLAGICGSDLHLIAVDGDLRVAPAALPSHSRSYLGHEVVGEVIEVGDEVQQVQIGDRVALQHGMNCISSGVMPPCRSCNNGNFTLCEQGNLPGPSPIGGGWSEEMLLHEQQLFRIPQDMSDEQAVMLEPTSVAVHAVLRRVPEAGERVLIVGAGTIGLLTLQAVRALAPQAEISVLARYPFQVEKATRMGASHIIYPQDSYREVQRVTQAQLYDGLLGNRMLLGGYDVIYDTIGNRGTIHNALRWTRAKGTIVLVGLNLHFMNIDLSPVWYQEINLLGTMGQGMEQWPSGTSDTTGSRPTFDITSDLIMQEQLHPEQLITHHFALSNYRTALQTAMEKQQGRAIKIVFDYSMQPASVVPNVRASASTRLRNHITTTLTPHTTGDIREREVMPVQSTARPVAPSFTPIQPIPSVSPASPKVPRVPEPSGVPIVSTPLTSGDIPATPGISELPTSSELDESQNDEESFRPSWEIRPTIDIAPPMPVLPVSIEQEETSPIEDEDKTISIAWRRDYHTYLTEHEIHEQHNHSGDTSNEQNGHQQPQIPEAQKIQTFEPEPERDAQEEAFYSFYTSEDDENSTIEPTDSPYPENTAIADEYDEQLQHHNDEDTLPVPAPESIGEPVGLQFVAPSSTNQIDIDQPDIDQSVIDQMDVDQLYHNVPDDIQPDIEQGFHEQYGSSKQSTNRTNIDKGHNRTKRRKKTHSLVLPTKPEDTNSVNKNGQ